MAHHDLREVCAVEGQYRSIAVHQESRAHIVLAGIREHALYIHFLNKQGQLSTRQPCGLGKFRFSSQAAVAFDASGNIIVLDGHLPAKMYIFGQDGILISTVKPCVPQFKQLNSLAVWRDKIFVAESEKVIVLQTDGTYSHEISVPGNAMSVDVRDDQYIYITDSKSNLHIFPIDGEGRIAPGKIGYCMMIEDYPVCMKLQGPEIWMTHGQKKCISVSTLSNEGMVTTKLLKHRGFVPLDMAWDTLGHLYVAMGVSATAKAALRVYRLEKSAPQGI